MVMITQGSVRLIKTCMERIHAGFRTVVSSGEAGRKNRRVCRNSFSCVGFLHVKGSTKYGKM